MRGLLLGILTLVMAHQALAAGAPRGRVDFFGLQLHVHVPPGEPTPELVRHLQRTIDRLDLDDYGLFRLAQVVATEAHPPRRAARAHARYLTRLLQELGVRASYLDTQVGPMVGIATTDYGNLSLPLQLGSQQLQLAVVLDGRLGEGFPDGLTLQIPADAMARGRPLQLSSRRLPKHTLRRRDKRSLRVPHASVVLAYDALPDAAAYLASWPAADLAFHAPLALDDLRLTGLADSLPSLRALGDEELVLDTLLQTLQEELTYKEGPMRSVVEILSDGSGDCDQQALLLWGALQALDVAPDRVMAVEQGNHLTLAVAPSHPSVHPSPAHGLWVEDRWFYFYDATTYVRDHLGATVSQWGTAHGQGTWSVVWRPAAD